MDKKVLITLGEYLFSEGLHKIQRDRALLSSFYEFNEAIGNPLRGRCSSCISTAFYSLRGKINALKNETQPITIKIDMNKEYKLKSPPYRIGNKTITDAELTPEIVAAIIQRFPQNWQVILEEKEAEPPKKTTRKKKTDTTKTEE